MTKKHFLVPTLYNFLLVPTLCVGTPFFDALRRGPVPVRK
jgi:hypothetical protein